MLIKGLLSPAEFDKEYDVFSLFESINCILNWLVVLEYIFEDI